MKSKKLTDSINEEFDLEIQAAFKKLREDAEHNFFECASEEDAFELEAVFKKFSEETESFVDEEGDSLEDSFPPVQQYSRQRAYLNPALYQAPALNFFQPVPQNTTEGVENHTHSKRAKLRDFDEGEMSSNSSSDYTI